MSEQDYTKRLLAANQKVEEREYWLKKLSGDFSKSIFPPDLSETAVEQKTGTINFRLPSGCSLVLMEISGNSDIKLHIVLAAGLSLLLHIYTGNEDVAIGTPIYRMRDEGDFINTVLVLRNTVQKKKTFRMLLQEMKQTVVEATDNRNYPVDILTEQLGRSYSSGNDFTLFDVALLLQNIHEKNYLRQTKHNMTFSFLRTSGDISVDAEYNGSFYRKTTVERILGHLVRLLEGVLRDIDLPVYRVDILSDEEKEQILYRFNDTRVPYPHDKTIHLLFREQVDRTPSRAAVVFEGETVTYRELDRRSDILASALTRNGVGVEDIVAIMVPRSIDMILGILAVLKAGGTYLPVNIDYPGDRINYMLADSRARLLLTRQSLSKELDIESAPSFTAIQNPQPAASLAYIIYTSGTTGKPKGVMVEHRNVVRLVKNSNFVDFNREERLLQTGALEFDASTFEIWGSLLNGWSLFLAHRDRVISASPLRETVQKYAVSIIWLTSPLFNQLCRVDVGVFKGLRYLLVGGDILSPPDIARVREAYPLLKVINGYGPTENTTFSTTHLIEREYTGSIPIGRPIANSTAYIVDSFGLLQPVGVPGELHVGGDGVSRGYLNAPELTTERFYRSKRSNRSYFFYRTGDLARWLTDGTIEFLGRIDRQVKIRGFRVELGEIENCLLKLPHIKETVVVDVQRDEKYLCAYIVSSQDIDISGLRGALSPMLPEYMIPSYFVRVERIPLTPNGKVDRNALPLPDVAGGDHYAPPENETQEKLIHIWADILNINPHDSPIGIDHDFFQLGGHSLKATILASKIHKEFNVKIPLSEIFTSPTIEGLSRYIDRREIETFTSIPPVEKRDYYLLSSAQKRLYILQQKVPRSTVYNIPQVILLPDDTDIPQVEKTFIRLIERHESLRTSFEMKEGQPIQRIYDQVEFRIENLNSLHPTPSPASIINRPFDLSKAPLIHVGLIKTGENTNRLIVDMHHIISDGTSLEILQRDFMSLNRGTELSPLPIQYKEYVQWQNTEKQKELLKQQEAYWLKQFEGGVPRLNIPTDYTGTKIIDFEGNILTDEISSDIESIKKLSLKAGATNFIVFLTIYNIFLSKVSGQDDIVVGTPAAGRNHADLQQVMGMFVNTLALRNHPGREKTFLQFLKEVKTNTLEAFNNQDYQFEDLVSAIAGKWERHNPIFDVMFQVREIDSNDESGDGSGTHPDDFQLRHTTAKFDLNLTIGIGKKLYVYFEYSTRLFKKKTIEEFSHCFREIVLSVLENENIKLKDIQITTVFTDSQLKGFGKELENVEF